MFLLNPFRAEIFQSNNVCKAVLMVLVSCGMVTAVVVRILGSTEATQHLSQSINPEPENDESFKVESLRVESPFVSP